MDDIGFLILIGAIGIGIGFAVGGLFFSLRHGDTSREKPRPGAKHILSLWRDQDRRTQLVQLDEGVYEVGDSLDQRLKAKVRLELAELNIWVKAGEETPKPEEEQPRLNAVPEPEPAAGIPAGATPLSAVSRILIGKKEPAPEKSIASQIDDILQEKLADSPLQNRAIRLMELPGKGMVVMVGLKQYDRIEDVPDEEIRKLIRSCVLEWEHEVYGA